MATPAKSVQARDVDSVVEMYTKMGIPAFAIRQNAAQPWRYLGTSMEQGAAELQWWLEKLQESESAAIYQLCLFEKPDKGITERTPCDLSINFQLFDHTRSFLPHEQYKGSYGAILGEIRELKKEMTDLRNGKQEDTESKLGIVGEIMEMEAVQPILVAVGQIIADKIMGINGGTVGELKRVSGIPGIISSPPVNGEPGPWRTDPLIIDALERLSVKVPDLGNLLQKLAAMCEQKPNQFNLYATMLRKTK